MLELIEYSVKEFYLGIPDLFLLGVFFFLLSSLVKGKNVFSAIRSSLSSSVFNIALMLLNVIVLPPVIFLLSIDAVGDDLVFISPEIWKNLPWVFVVFCSVFAGDFIGYWRHRLEHSRMLWPSHSIHHSDTKMTWLTLHRFHPINRLTTYIVDSSVLLSLGFPLYAVMASNLVRHYYGYFIHADLPWVYGKWSLVFVSPVMHRWHHADNPSAYNTNYATIFSVFDRLFGTYYVPRVCDVELGSSDIGSSSFLKQMLYPFRLSSYVKSNE